MPNTRTLLITDDCPEDREVYREYLLSDPHQSYRILEAGSAELGLALCQQEQCDAILLDFCLPDMSGLEFLDHLKQQVDSPLPVIMLTGQGDESVAVQAMKRGAQDYLVKQHLQSDVLQLTVRNAIERSSPRSTFHQEQERRHLVESIALRIRQSLNLEQVLQAVVTEIQQLLECDRVVVYQGVPHAEGCLTQTATQRLIPVCEAGSPVSHPDPVQQFTAFLVERGQTHLSPVARSARSTPRRSSIYVSHNRRHPQTYLLTPIEWNSPETTSVQLWGVLVACRKAGEHQWQLDEVNLLNELSGQVSVAVQQAEQLSQALAALEHEKQLNAMQAQVTVSLAHAYRSPLATILAAASTLKQQGDRLDEAKQWRFLQMIEDKVRHMTSLVEDLLVLKQLESGKTTCKRLPFNLLQFFADVVEEQQAMVNDRSSVRSAPASGLTPHDLVHSPLTPAHSVHHELTLKISGNTKGFWGDRDLLRQILIHLLANAIQYSPQGGAIEVHLSGSESQIKFSVQDQGIGIPMEDQAHLWQAGLYRGSNVGEIAGTGLGLAIVKTCVELHEGEITVHSQEEQGTTVTVCLPKR